MTSHPPAVPGRESGADLAARLSASFGDAVVFLPGSPEYESATAPDNSSFRQQPDLVVRPRSAQDVATVVTAAREGQVRVVVQATGHGARGPITSGTVVIDTSSLDDVTVDPRSRTARVGAGVQWSQVQAEAEQHGLLGLAGTSPTVGVTGYLLNGGIGWLVRPHGLGAASLRAVEYVDGQGEIRHTDSDPDALWAFRGGAPPGIATSLELDLVPVEDLWAGLLMWPAARLPELARVWLDQTGRAPAGVSTDIALLRLPPEGPFPPELLGTVVVHVSYASVDGADALDGLRAALRAVAEPAVDTTGPADAAALAKIHLDPPVAVPARGTGLWLEQPDADQLVAILHAAGIGEPDGLNMIELRHVAPADAAAGVPDGALVRVPASFLLHAVGSGPDDETRAATDARLADVEAAAAVTAIGLTAPAFRSGRPDIGAAHPPEVLDRLLAIVRDRDPHGVFAFQRSGGCWVRTNVG